MPTLIPMNKHCFQPLLKELLLHGVAIVNLEIYQWSKGWQWCAMLSPKWDVHIPLAKAQGT